MLVQWNSNGTERTLPSIRALVNLPGFPCQRCGQGFERVEQRDFHQPRCNPGPAWPQAQLSFDAPGTMGPPRGVPMHPAYEPRGLPVRSIESRHVSFHEAPRNDVSRASPASSSGESARTPPPSRRNSGGIVKRRSPAAAANNYTHAILVRRAREPQLTEEEKREQKKQKEKDSREAMSNILQITEDLHQNYLDLRPDHPQSAGNGNEAGLEVVKIDNHRGNLCLLAYFLHRDHMKALEENRLEEWRKEMRTVVNSWRERNNLTEGTWLDDPDGEPFEACQHERKSKFCHLHGHENHVRCRKDRLQKRFQDRLEAWKMEHS